MPALRTFGSRLLYSRSGSDSGSDSSLSPRPRLGLALALAISLSLALSPASALAEDQILRPEDHPGLPPGLGGGTLTTSGDWLALGALRATGDVETDTGRVLLWKRVNGLWQPRQILAPVVKNVGVQDLFGSKVVMDGKRMVVASGYGSPQVHTYVLNGDTWVFDGFLKPQAGDITNDTFGIEEGIAISGDTVAVASSSGRVRGFDNVGWVDVFQRTGAGWTRTARLTDTAPLGTALANTSIRFGYCIGLQRDLLLAAIQDDADPAARIALFKKTGATWVRQRDLRVADTHFLLQDLSPSPAGDRLFVGLPNLMREYSLTRPYELLSEREGPGTARVRGKSLVWHSYSSVPTAEVPLQHQLPDRTWVQDRLLGPADTGLARVAQAHLTGRELLVSGFPPGWNATFQIRSIPQATPMLEFHHSGDVTEAPPTVPAADRVFLQAGDYPVGKEVTPLVTLSAFLPVPSQGAALETAPVTVHVGLTGDEAEFSIPTYELSVHPGKRTDLKVNFKPLTPGPKRLHVTFSRLEDPSFLVRYEITAQAVSQGTPVQITQQPQSGLYGPFQSQGLQVEATGTRPITYRWLRNGAPVSGGTGPSLWPQEGGTYTVEVSNPHGPKVVSAPAALGFYALQQPITIVRPGAPARCVVALSGPGLTVRWMLNDPLVDGPIFSGVSTPVLTVKKVTDPEGYSALVTMPTPQGGQLTGFTRHSLVYGVLPPEIHSFDASYTYRVGDEVNFTPPYTYGNGPNYNYYPRFTYSGLPPGVKADAQGNIVGTFTTPGVYSVQTTLQMDIFTVRKTLKLTILLNGPTPGIYWGHLPPSDNAPDPGAVMLDVNPAGTYTGTLWVGTTRTPLAGSLVAVEGSTTPERPYPVKIGGMKHVFWLRSSFYPAQLDFHLRPASEPADGTGADGEILASITLIRPRGLPVDPAGTGRFNFGLMADINDSEATGHGFGTLNVLPSGLVTCIGQLPDGSALTGSAWLDESTNVYFHLADSRTRSVLYRAEATGTFCLWHRPPTPGRFYPGGILAKPFAFMPSRYRARAGQPLLEFPERLLRLNVPGTYPPNTSVTLTGAHTARFGPGDQNPLQARMDFYPPTGFFTGQLTLRDEDPSNPARTIVRTVQYRGLLLQEQDMGLGSFLVPALPDPLATPPTTIATSPMLSGALDL